MKKFFIFIAVLLLALQAYAGMDSVNFTATVIGVATNTKSYTLRGEVEAIKITVPTDGTGTVTFASEELTLLSASAITATATYMPRSAIHTTAGVAIVSTGATTNTVYGKMPIAGVVTMTVVGGNEASETNSWIATLIYKR